MFHNFYQGASPPEATSSAGRHLSASCATWDTPRTRCASTASVRYSAHWASTHKNAAEKRNIRGFLLVAAESTKHIFATGCIRSAMLFLHLNFLHHEGILCRRRDVTGDCIRTEWRNIRTEPCCFCGNVMEGAIMSVKPPILPSRSCNLPQQRAASPLQPVKIYSIRISSGSVDSKSTPYHGFLGFFSVTSMVCAV